MLGEAARVELVDDKPLLVERGAARASELTAALDVELRPGWRMAACLLEGLSKTSANLGTRIQLARSF